MLSKTVGQRLKSLRVSSDLTQTEMAEKLDIAQSTLANYEKDFRFPTIDVLIKLADFFRVPVDYILGTGAFKDWDLLMEKKSEIAKMVSKSAMQLSVDMLNGLDEASFSRIVCAFNIKVEKSQDGNSITMTDPISTDHSEDAFQDYMLVTQDDRELLSNYKQLNHENRTLVRACAIILKKGEQSQKNAPIAEGRTESQKP